MEWTDDGIVLGTRRHGEANAILEVMTQAHGRHLGLVRGGAGSRMRPVLQPGNTVRATWRARLEYVAAEEKAGDREALGKLTGGGAHGRVVQQKRRQRQQPVVPRPSGLP